MAHELDERINEMTADRHYYNGWRQHVNKDDNVTWRDGKQIMCAVVQPDKVPKNIDTAPIYNVLIPDLGHRVNSGEWTFRDASAHVPDMMCKHVDELTGETFEDQYQFEKTYRWIDARMGGNYLWEPGLMPRRIVLSKFEEQRKVMRFWQDWYQRGMVGMRKRLRTTTDKKALERIGDYGAANKKWIEEKNIIGLERYLALSAGYVGTISDEAKWLELCYDVITRSIEVVDKKYKEFEFVDEFTNYAMAVFSNFRTMRENDEDITDAVPNIPWDKYLNRSPFVTDNKVKEFRKKLTEPL